MSPSWVKFLLLVFSSLANATEDFKACPRGWKERPFICFKDSENEYDFGSGLAYCLNQQSLDHWNGFNVGLIGVGQLRKFRNKFDFAVEVQRRHYNFHTDRNKFRVNARKDQDGTWREFFTGNEVEFHHFPGFDPHSGKRGDTLVWDSDDGRLHRADPDEKFPVLCATKKSDSCNDCPDAQWESECSNAGDCLNGKCFCDKGFEGFKCQIPPMEISNLELFIYAGDPSNPGEKLSLQHNTSCLVEAQLPENVENSVTGAPFGQPISCGGNLVGGTAIKQCWTYRNHHRHDVWSSSHPGDMMTPRSKAAATVISDVNRDKIYWVTFGEDELGQDLANTEILTWYGDWIQGPNLTADFRRQAHCALQINDCEAAVLGGLTDGDSYRDDILIFNFEDAKWKQGPKLRNERANLACATIKDSQSGHPIVITACGTGPLGIETSVESWDLTTWETRVLPYKCPTSVDYFRQAWPVSDHEIVLVSGQEVWSFTLDYGFRKVADLSVARSGSSGSALLQKGTVDCA